MFLISENYDDRVALINGDGYSLTYKEFKDLVRSFSSYLDSRALIFIIGSNDIASLVCYFSSFEKNIVPLLLSKDILNNQLDDLEKKVDCVTKGNNSHADAAKSKATQLENQKKNATNFSTNFSPP